MDSGNFKSEIKSALNYRKQTFWIIAAVIVILIIVIKPETDTKNKPYIFEGVTSIQVGDSYFLAEDKPETTQEELVYQNFLYKVERNFDEKYEILSNTETHKISIENEKSNTDPDIYTSYVIHEISTVDKSEQDADKILKKYNLSEYEIINAIYTQKHSPKLLTLGPQWGDGTYSRNFIVGRSKTDKSYKIYDFLLPLWVED
nr:hypothetical protein [Sedimentibacter sp.]